MCLKTMFEDHTLVINFKAKMKVWRIFRDISFVRLVSLPDTVESLQRHQKSEISILYPYILWKNTVNHSLLWLTGCQNHGLRAIETIQ